MYKGVRGSFCAALVFGAILAACSTGGASTGEDASVDTASEERRAGAGHVVYRLVDGPLFRVAAKTGAKPQNLSRGLKKRYGSDPGLNFGNTSPNGEWLVIDSELFGCGGYACLAVLRSDLSGGKPVRGGEIHPTGYSAVANGGKLVVFPSSGNGGRTDLFASRRSGGGWAKPVKITSSSPRKIHGYPAISSDGKTVIHDCGSANDPSTGAISICESQTDGSGTEEVVSPKDGPKPLAEDGEASLHHPDYLAGGGIVFEANWCCAESLWWLPEGSSEPRRSKGASSNNVGPCGLPSGKVASLDLTRSPVGYHELMIHSVTKKGRDYIVKGADVLDAGIGCGR